jgi:hypothetical protein
VTANQFAGCQNGTSTSQLYGLGRQLGEDYFFGRNYFSDGDCGRDVEDASYQESRFYMGVCVQGDLRRSVELGFGFPSVFQNLASRETSLSSSSSFMFLLNVNASFEAPQDPTTVDPSVPLLMQVEEDCYSANNCSFNGQPLFTISLATVTLLAVKAPHPPCLPT